MPPLNMNRNIITTLLIGIWLLVADHASAFQSEYISVKAEGKGPDIVLIHGFASSPMVWSGVAEEMRHQYRLHLVTVAGFAGSTAPKVQPKSYLNMLRVEIARYIDEEKLEQPTLIGHSMGGLIALLVASNERLKVGKVIVVDALPFFSLLFNPMATTEQILPQAKALEKQIAGLDDQGFERQAKALISTLTKSDEKKALILEWSKQSDRKVFAGYLGELMAYDARPELKRVTCPVTVLYAYDAAMGVPEEQLERLYSTAYAQLKTITIKIVPDSFHFVMWDQPKHFYSAMKEALIPLSLAPTPN